MVPFNEPYSPTGARCSWCGGCGNCSCTVSGLGATGGIFSFYAPSSEPIESDEARETRLALEERAWRHEQRFHFIAEEARRQDWRAPSVVRRPPPRSTAWAARLQHFARRHSKHVLMHM